MREETESLELVVTSEFLAVNLYLTLLDLVTSAWSHFFPANRVA